MSIWALHAEAGAGVQGAPAAGELGFDVPPESRAVVEQECDGFLEHERASVRTDGVSWQAPRDDSRLNAGACRRSPRLELWNRRPRLLVVNRAPSPGAGIGRRGRLRDGHNRGRLCHEFHPCQQDRTG